MIFRILGVVALLCSAWSTAILGIYLRKPGQDGWDAWRLLAISTLGGALSGAALLLLG